MTQASATKRQRTRKALLLISLVLFPITIFYFSPYIIIESASRGTINASFIMFVSQFVVALFLGRVFCAWACPSGALQEYCFAVNDKRARGGKFDWIKYVIWVPWLSIIATLAISAGGYHAFDVFFHLESGISLSDPYNYIIYIVVLVLFLSLSFLAGRRAGCHYICWMAPFMILGRRIRNIFKWPALRLKVENAKCISCQTCTKNCPKSLEVHDNVQSGLMEHDECILCGTCVDGCPQDVIDYSFSAGV
ncbi:MAG: 4Fe-4S binding protein [Chloroflexi bacterium]|nr:4Fe-4S binding protein [Chloroflexota bacterium]